MEGLKGLKLTDTVGRNIKLQIAEPVLGFNCIICEESETIPGGYYAPVMFPICKKCLKYLKEYVKGREAYLKNQ